MKFQFSIDRGGTFTDVFARCPPDGRIRVLKLLSVDPSNYPDAPREGIRRILSQELNREIKEPIPTELIEWVRMGTTVATNALLERKGQKMALAVTEGFKDLLYIGNQTRPKIFDLKVEFPGVLYSRVITVQERVVLAQKENCRLNLEETHTKVSGTTEEEFYVVQPINLDKLRRDLRSLQEEGIKSLAVVCLHSYAYARHEEIIGEIARKEFGFTHVSLSSKISPMVRIVPRGFTASVDAYLTPCIQQYIEGFFSGFSDRNLNVLFMQSDGGLTEEFTGSRAIISGPAGGVVGYAKTAPSNNPVIGFDMGGTSTDVSRYDNHYEHVFETTTAGVTIQAPQLDVNTVAAGGGSMLFFRSGLFVVGPESASAHPGPVCYRKNGPLAITDANLLLGRILPEYFPKIFGPNEDQSLDKDGSVKAFEKLGKLVNESLKTLMSVEEVAMGFIRVANEAMCRPIRALTQGKGFDTAHHSLACFGGAGGQHACAIARSLGMKTVYVHKYAGILSAYGMALADVVHEQQLPCSKKYQESNFPYFKDVFGDLVSKCRNDLKDFANFKYESYLNLRYSGTDCALMCEADIDDLSAFQSKFIERYQTEFGFTLKDRDIVVDDIRIRGIGQMETGTEKEIENMASPPPVEKQVRVYFDKVGYQNTHVYLLKNLKCGHGLTGPCIVMDELSTILIEPNCIGSIDKHGNLKIDILADEETTINDDKLDTIQLSIFSHRFMSIAEQMGRILQRTSISTNIKERLDFSCALFGPDGGLVSNAPHIPVHLGAMQDTVRHQMRVATLNRGDVLLANHPKAGGSHLPDLTVITPVFYGNESEPVFFVANRGHHADIGGITPGSMPPHSKSLAEEGAAFKSFKIVESGVFQEEKLIEKLNEPSKYPGCSGTRALQDNISDLNAQIAANQKGISLVCELIDFYGLKTVQNYMKFIQENAEIAVRDMLKEIVANNNGKTTLEACDFMDDGSKINLVVDINPNDGSALFDFTGSGLEVYGNTNAPKAVTMSALIYSIRAMIGHDIPLNQGCLNPIRVIIPEGSILDPSENAAVVGGNVLTSQRLVDVVLKAFSAVSASQGCCNNITFGDENFGYYETVAGGSGAGPSWHGRSGVHTHMTNTRLTDPEILERRYPVILNRFSLVENTGGIGKFKGGNGVVREIKFRKKLSLSVLTERRVLSPYGLKGGGCGNRGENRLKRGHKWINLGGKCAINVEAGDIFRLQTPGGGGYGKIDDDQDSMIIDEQSKKFTTFTNRGSVFEYKSNQESA